MSQNNSEIDVEFSRPIDVSRILAKGRQCKFEATEQERVALAERYAVLRIKRLDVECFIIPLGGKGRKKRYKLDGTFKASIVQECSISLDSIKVNISSEFAIILQPELSAYRSESTEVEFNYDEEDVEFLIADVIDVGEMVAQHLSLEIPAYPRRKGATGTELGQKIIKEKDFLLESEKKNPFDVLKSLKHKT
ncbi:MAG: DUF177 domain-containing protein [Emcibacter sp.]|nr:DUF177 domain-containing protein [Emcibacter sp.]